MTRKGDSPQIMNLLDKELAYLSTTPSPPVDSSKHLQPFRCSFEGAFLNGNKVRLSGPQSRDCVCRVEIVSARSSVPGKQLGHGDNERAGIHNQERACLIKC